MLTFLFTDIQGSTKKWQLFEGEMAEVLKRHDRIIEDSVGRWGGTVVKHTGDGFMAAFRNGCALECSPGYPERDRFCGLGRSGRP